MKNLWSPHTIEVILQDTELSDQKLDALKTDLTGKSVDISDVVEALGPALTTTNTEHRAFAMEFLSKLLIQLPSDFLDTKQLNFISTFYADRSKDHHSVIPSVISGVLALIKMTNISSDNVLNLFNSLFLNTTCQSQLSNDRANIYRIFQVITERHADVVKKTESEFVYTVIHAIEGERDPSNLLYLYNFMPSFMKVFSLGHLADDMFEIFECYFPIDYHPIRNENVHITRDILAKGLCQCLCSHPDFFEKCLELVFEKIDSDLIVAKQDSLDLLLSAIKSFSIYNIEKNFDKIWSSIKFELLQGSTKEIKSVLFEIVEEIVVLSHNDRTLTENFLKIILNSILINLSDIEESLYQTSIKLLFICIRARQNNYATIYLGDNIIPILLRQLNYEDGQGQDNWNKINQLLDVLARLWETTIVKNCHKEIEAHLLEDTQTEYLKYLMSDNFQLTQKILDCLERNCEIIGETNRIVVYNKINLLLLNNSNDNNNNYININSFMVKFAATYPDEIYEHIIRNLIANETNNNKINDIIIILLLNSYYQTYSIEYLINNIFALGNLAIVNNLHSFYGRLNGVDENVRALNCKLYKEYDVITKLNGLIKMQRDNDDELNDKISQIINLIVRTLTEVDQIGLIEQYLADGGGEFRTSSDYYIFVGLFDGIAETLDLFKYLNQTLCNLMREESIVNSLSDSLKFKYYTVVCSLFNKVTTSDDCLTNVIKQFYNDNILVKSSLDQANNDIIMLSWIIKGIFIKGDQYGEFLIKEFIKLLDQAKYSATIVKAFEIITLNDESLHLPHKRLFYKQKLFQIVLHDMIVPKLDSNSFSSDDLLVISYVFGITPYAVLKQNLTKIIKIIYKCVEQRDSYKSIEISLKLLNKFIGEKEEYFNAHFNYLVDELIKLSQIKDALSIRILALEVLSNLTSYPEILTLKHREDVVYGLIPVLDDSKRLVRTAAVRARNTWFLLGTE